jgi:kynurenine formamidase
MRRYFLLLLALLLAVPAQAQDHGLWQMYQHHLKGAKYVDLTFAFSPTSPVWPGFNNAEFRAATAGNAIPGYVEEGETYTYDEHGFVASSYVLPTDQYGTQLDPPAHWNKRGATISDLPPTYAVRPLVVVDIHEKVAEQPGYHAKVKDVKAWEKRHGEIPDGAVVFFRSDWHEKWASNPDRYNKKPFPGVALKTAKYLHEKKDILFHGHEPLDTDTTAGLVTEDWILNNNYAQAEGVTNLDKVPEQGALVAIGFAKPKGGTGGYARYIAICPSDWEHGVTMDEVPGAPLPEHDHPLRRDETGVLRPTPPDTEQE